MNTKEQLTLEGIPAAPGLAHGKTIHVVKQKLIIPHYEINNVEKEIHRLKKACKESKTEILEMKAEVNSRSQSNEAEIFEAHSLILEDEALFERAEKAINQGFNAEKAWMDAIEYYAQMMERIPDETLANRATDIRDVGHRVLSHLLGVSYGGSILTEPAIVIGDDLTPSDTVNLDKDLVLGFCTAQGGPTSHTAILAKAFGLPAVVGIGAKILEIPEKTMVLVDGDAGIVIISPDKRLVEAFTTREEEDVLNKIELQKEAQNPAFTLNGEQIEIVANVGSVADAPIGIENGAEGVGLFRTEFLYLNRNSLPTEEEQIEAYQDVFKCYEGKNVVVRTLDIGGDKVIPYLDLPEELNPFLGWRGIRMIDELNEIFLKQFRSILQAGENLNIDLCIMIPMVSVLEEIKVAKALMKQAKADLKSEGKPIKKRVQFGIMIEVPSAALLSNKLAKEVDFFSIGTNDLTQYTMAVDRTNSKVAHIANPLNPAVLALIKQTIISAHVEGKWVGLCGEMAGEPLATPILLGLGLDEFSMSPGQIPIIKHIIRQLNKEDCHSIAEQAIQLSSHEEVINLSKTFLTEIGLVY